MAQSSTMQVGSYEINVILTNFTMMLLPPLSTIYWFAVSSKLIIFTTVTFIKVVMFDCSMHCIQWIIKVQSSKYSLDRCPSLTLSNNPKILSNYLIFTLSESVGESWGLANDQTKNEAHQSMKGQKLIVFINGKRTNHNEMFSGKHLTFCRSLCQRQAVPRFTCLAFFSPTFSTFLYNQQSFPNPTLDIWCSFLASLHILHISLQSFLYSTLNAQFFFTGVLINWCFQTMKKTSVFAICIEDPAVEFLWEVLFEMSLSKSPDRSN